MMLRIKIFLGFVHYKNGNRKWHIGKCSPTCKFNDTPYSGIFVPFCQGGFGYILSRDAINLIKNDDTYKNSIYEDVHIAILLKNNNINPTNINIKHFVKSPDHK